MQKLCRLLPALLAMALCPGASPAWAQGTTSRVTGVVSDSSGGSHSWRHRDAHQRGDGRRLHDGVE